MIYLEENITTGAMGTLIANAKLQDCTGDQPRCIESGWRGCGISGSCHSYLASLGIPKDSLPLMMRPSQVLRACQDQCHRYSQKSLQEAESPIFSISSATNMPCGKSVRSPLVGISSAKCTSITGDAGSTHWSCDGNTRFVLR